MKKLVESNAFQVVVFVVILLNTVILGLETSPTIRQVYGPLLKVVDSICLGFFVAELLCKIVAYKGSFFKSGWNWFDLLIVLGSFITTIDGLASMRVLRLLKEIRVLRLISSLKPLQVIVSAIIKCIPSVFFTAFLLLILYYVYAIVGVNMMGKTSPEYFGSIGNAMISLFQIMTLDDWGEIMRSVSGTHPCSWIYFISFVFISSIIMLNVVVGIAVNFFAEAYRENRIVKTDDITTDIEAIQTQLEQLKLKLKR
ncbi:MAG: ion transporter [Bacteroidales bacterium]|nr:ion transporter [Bacteroidales bacterium]